MKIKNVAIGIAIILLTIFVVIYGINTFYSAPEYEDFCGEFKTMEIINDSTICEEIGGKWEAYGAPKPVDETEGYCDRDFTCRKEYNSAREKYSKNLFLTTLPLGILIIILGALIFKLESVGAGLMGGGIGIILWGVVGFWRFANNWLKFLLSLIALIILIWLAYYLNKKFKKKK